MPIKDPTIYPPYWKQFSKYIRFERAENSCEKCDRKNGDLSAKFTIVVLTVAHLDHEGGPCDCKQTTGRKCARPDHVLALCQACHLALDLPKHIENRRISLMETRDARRSLFNEMPENPIANPDCGI